MELDEANENKPIHIKIGDVDDDYKNDTNINNNADDECDTPPTTTTIDSPSKNSKPKITVPSDWFSRTYDFRYI